MASCTFRGTTIWDETTNGVAYDVSGFLIVREVGIDPPPLGDGEFVHDFGRAGADGTLSLTYRAADNGLAALFALLEGIAGPPRGTLVTPEGTFTNCIVTAISPPSPRRVKLQSGSPGWIVAVDLTFRRSA